MTVTDGSFTVPTSVYIPGTIEVLGWSNVLITVDTIPVENLLSLSSTANINFGSGTASIEAGDPERDQYDVLLEGTEVEIYLKQPDINIANKVWGGFLETNKWEENKKNVLKLTAKEYSSRLVQQKIGAALTWTGADLRTVMLDTLAKQTDFTYESITAMAVTGHAITMSFTEDTVIYDVIRKACEQADYYFGIDLNKDCYIRKKTDVFLSADQLIAGDNVMINANIETNKEFQLTAVTVKSKPSTTAYSGSAASTVPALTQTRTVYMPGITSDAAAALYAASLIETNQSPLFTAVVPSYLLMYTQPTMAIYCNIPKKALVGNYTVVEITHEWSVDTGIKTTTMFSNKIIDTTMEIGFLSRRINALESKSFS